VTNISGSSIGPNSTGWWLLGLGSAAALGALAISRRSGDAITRSILGPPVETLLHVANARGVVEADPAGLARASGYSLPVYALASCMQSEEKTDKGRLAVGLAAWNAAKHKASRLPRLFLYSKRKDGDGHFGTQAGRYADTRHPPTAKTLQLAQAIVDGRVADITRGAVQWDAPKLQDADYQLYLKDPQKYPEYRFSSEDIVKQRTAAGRRMVVVPGVTETRFWAPV